MHLLVMTLLVISMLMFFLRLFFSNLIQQPLIDHLYSHSRFSSGRSSPVLVAPALHLSGNVLIERHRDTFVQAVSTSTDPRGFPLVVVMQDLMCSSGAHPAPRVSWTVWSR